MAALASSIGGLALWYYEHKKSQEVFANEIRSLVTEISNRAYQTLNRIDSVEEAEDMYKLLWGYDPVTDLPYIVYNFNEYNGQNLPSLVLLLQQKLSQISSLSEQEQKVLREAVASSQYLIDFSTTPSPKVIGAIYPTWVMPNTKGRSMHELEDIHELVDMHELKEKIESALKDVHSLKCFGSSPKFVSYTNLNPQPC